MAVIWHLDRCCYIQNAANPDCKYYFLGKICFKFSLMLKYFIFVEMKCKQILEICFSYTVQVKEENNILKNNRLLIQLKLIIKILNLYLFRCAA